MIRALWAAGTKPYAGQRTQLPETTCYPRPVSQIPIIVGGSGERRTLQIAARHADACNLPSDLETLDHKLEVLKRHCAEAGRDIAVTVLDVPIVGRDREHVAALVEKLRGRTPAAAFARRHHAGTAAEHLGGIDSSPSGESAPCSSRCRTSPARTMCCVSPRSSPVSPRRVPRDPPRRSRPASKRARSFADVPPQTPKGSRASSAHFRQFVMTGHDAQICLARRSRRANVGPRSRSPG